MSKYQYQIKSKNQGLNYSGFWILVFICHWVFGFWIFMPQTALAATNIDFTDRWAWNDVLGWIDFYSTNSVVVQDLKIEGYATSSVGYIAMDCATGPAGSSCSPVSYSVNKDGSGTLSGWAWSQNIGWFSFNCNNDTDPDAAGVQSYCPTANHSVTIDNTGDFSGWAWNDIVGWISFNKKNCDTDNNNFVDVGPCGGNNFSTVAIAYKVKTDVTNSAQEGTLESGIFDSGVTAGAAFNSIMWQGRIEGSPTPEVNVKFRVATSNSDAGPWDYLGDDGTTNTYYRTSGPDAPAALRVADHHNKRYIRFKVYLTKKAAAKPVVTDVIINWSP